MSPHGHPDWLNHPQFEFEHLSHFERYLLMTLQENNALIARLVSLLNQAIAKIQAEPSQTVLTASDQADLDASGASGTAAADAADAILNPPPPAPAPAAEVESPAEDAAEVSEEPAPAA